MHAFSKWNMDKVKNKKTMKKTIEQERGAILAKRLQLLNDYLISEAEGTFGEYIASKGVTEKMFLSELPADYRFNEVGKQTLSDEDSKEELMDYTEDLNVLYFEQYLAHEEKVEDAMGADGAESNKELMGGVSNDSVVGWDYASGKKKDRKAAKKANRDKIKKAKAEKRAEKKRIKALKKSGKISGKEARELKKKNRKDMRGKVGSWAGRAVGKLNKFNPALVAVRNAFLSLLKINAAGLASAFRYMKKDGGKHWQKMEKKWRVLGGEPFALGSAIDTGAHKKPFPKLKKKKRNADGDEEDLNTDDPKNAGKAAAQSAGALGGLTAVLASNPATAPAAVYVGSAGAVLAVASPILKAFAGEKGEDTSGIPELPALDLDPGTEDALKDVDKGADDEKGGGFGDFISEYKYWLLGGLGLLTLGGILISVMGGNKSK